jgi:CRP-like cAMP-binding protein
MRVWSAPGVRSPALAAGDSFGELALLDRGPRSATVSAMPSIPAWALSGDRCA